MKRDAYELKRFTDEENKRTHPEQSINGRNTKPVPGKQRRQRARAWCFTINGHTTEDIDTLTHPNSKILKYIFQEEIGKSGNEHLQGVVYLKNACGLGTMKSIHPRAHWEPSRNWQASKNYCTKQDSKNGKVWRKGCRENRIKEKIPDKEILKSMKSQLVKRVLEEIKYVCWEVGHNEGCGCTKALEGPTDPLPKVGHL